jgi:hypothetical protein
MALLSFFLAFEYIIKQLLNSVYDIENYQGLGLCYPAQSSALVDNKNLGLDNSRYHTQPHSIIVYYHLDVQGTTMQGVAFNVQYIYQ